MSLRASTAMRPIASTLVCLVVASCVSSTEPVEVLTWEGTLVAAEGVADGVAGSLAMVIGESQTQIGIAVRLAPAGISLGWSMRSGTCATSGERVGPVSAFPPISVDAEGDGQTETVLFRRIPTAGPYAGEIRENADGTGAVLACADMELRD